MDIQHLLGKIHAGDCIEFMKKLPDGCINMILTDPPYGHGNHSGDLNAHLNAHRGLEDKPIVNDTMDDMKVVVSEMLTEAVRVLKPDSCCVCCCCGGGGGPRPTFAWLANRMDTLGLQFFHSVIWDKVNPGLGWRYRRQHEMVMVAHKTGGKLLWADDSHATANIMRHSKPRGGEHPNEKPIPLMAKFIELHAKKTDVVFDPFCGSGTTLVAAERLGRLWLGCEVDEKWCLVAQKRVDAEREQPKLF